MAGMCCYATAGLDADRGYCETMGKFLDLMPSPECHLHGDCVKKAPPQQIISHPHNSPLRESLCGFQTHKKIRKVKRLAQGHKASKVEELRLKPESHDSRPQRKKG